MSTGAAKLLFTEGVTLVGLFAKHGVAHDGSSFIGCYLTAAEELRSN
jgi:hypothetical protein